MTYRTPRKYVLQVRIVDGNCLDVIDDNGQNEIGTDEQLQLIEWTFTPDVPGTVQFGYPGRAGVGQHWMPGHDKDPERWFRPPSINGRTIQMKVSHHTDLSDGEWIYQLHAYDTETNDTYSTIYVKDGRILTVTNPVIINK